MMTNTNPRGVTETNENNDSSGYDRAYRAEYNRLEALGHGRPMCHAAAMSYAARTAYRGLSPMVVS